MSEDKDKEVIKIGQKVLRESDLEFPVEYDGEVFTLRHPAPYQKALIESEIARRLGGFSRDAYPNEHLALIEATTYVDALVVRDKSPSWWKGAWTCYDEDLIYTLYRGYYQFRGDLQEKLRRDGP